MRVRISFSVDVDPQAWGEEYGAGDVREDVKLHAQNMVLGHLDSLGLLASQQSDILSPIRPVVPPPNRLLAATGEDES